MTALLGVVCTILSLVFIWPQMHRVWVRRQLAGLSPIGMLHGAAGSGLWFAYGVARADVPLTVSNGLVGGAVASMVWVLVRARHLERRVALQVALTVGATGVALAITRPTLLGVTAIVVGATSILPQLWRTLTDHRSGHGLDGVSVPTYVLLTTAASCWSLYGVLTGDPIIVAPNLVIVPCAATIAVLAARNQRAARPAAIRR